MILWLSFGFLCSVGILFLLWLDGMDIKMTYTLYVIPGTVLPAFSAALLLVLIILSIEDRGITIVRGRKKDDRA